MQVERLTQVDGATGELIVNWSWELAGAWKIVAPARLQQLMAAITVKIVGAGYKWVVIWRKIAT